MAWNIQQIKPLWNRVEIHVNIITSSICLWLNTVPRPTSSSHCHHTSHLIPNFWPLEWPDPDSSSLGPEGRKWSNWWGEWGWAARSRLISSLAVVWWILRHMAHPQAGRTRCCTVYTFLMPMHARATCHAPHSHGAVHQHMAYLVAEIAPQVSRLWLQMGGLLLCPCNACWSTLSSQGKYLSQGHLKLVQLGRHGLDLLLKACHLGIQFHVHGFALPQQLLPPFWHGW